MQRLFDLSKWSLLKEGARLSFLNKHPRKVTLEVNAPGPVLLYVLIDGTPNFLAKVDGRDTIEFHPDGPFDLVAEGGNLNVYTADGADIAQEALDDRIFTKIVQRRPRNIEMEIMQRAARENTERLLNAQRKEMEAYIARLEAQRTAQAAAAATDPATQAPDPKRAPASSPAASGSGNGNEANG